MPINRLEDIRLARGLTQEALAEIMHTTGATISRWQSHDTRLDLDILSRLTKVLKCTIAQLAGEEPFQLAEDGANIPTRLDRRRLIACVDALDHYLAESRMRVAPGGRGDLIVAIYDWTIDADIATDDIGDLSRIRSLLRPSLQSA